MVVVAKRPLMFENSNVDEISSSREIDPLQMQYDFSTSRDWRQLNVLCGRICVETDQARLRG